MAAAFILSAYNVLALVNRQGEGEGGVPMIVFLWA